MRRPPFRSQHLPRRTLAKPLPSSFPSFPSPTLHQFQFHSKQRSDSNSLVAEQPISGARKPRRGLAALHARSAGLRLSVGPREDAQANGQSGPRAATLPQRPPPGVAPGRAAEPHHPTGGGAGPGACARRSRACGPHSPPPTLRACHFLPSPHLRPGSVSRSLWLPERLRFPLLTRSTAVAQALQGGGDRERERLT